jgi:hypothetical protein
MKRSPFFTIAATLAFSLWGQAAAAQWHPDFQWSSAGPIGGLHCTQVVEGASPPEHTWRDNYLCSSRDLGMRWSSSGPIGGMRCTQIAEGAEPPQYTWRDNYLCLPLNSPLILAWSSTGPIAGLDCVQIHESRDPYTWHDNFLCWQGPNQTADLLTITKIRNIKPASGLDNFGRGVFAVIGAAANSVGGVSLPDLYNGAKYGIEVAEFLDSIFAGHDDLIVKVDGHPILKPIGASPHWTEVDAGQVLYPNARISINGAARLRLIDRDDSDNENLGDLIILGGRNYSASEIIVTAPDPDDGSIYAISYTVQKGMGDPRRVVASMLCGTNQCDDCRRLDCEGQPYHEDDD